jgi:hypothetical protein
MANTWIGYPKAKTAPFVGDKISATGAALTVISASSELAEMPA